MEKELKLYARVCFSSLLHQKSEGGDLFCSVSRKKMPYSIFIVNSAPGCSLPDDSSVISDVVTNLKSFHATGDMLKRRRLQRKQLRGQKWQELQRGISSFGILHAQVTQLRNLYTCSVKKKKSTSVDHK